MSLHVHSIIRRTLGWGTLLFCCAILQTTVFAWFRPFGAVPDLMLAAVLAISIFDGERAGAVAGIAGGVIIGALGGIGINILPLCYMLCGYLCGIWSTVGLSANFPSWVIYILSGAGIRAVITLVCIGIRWPTWNPVSVFFGVLLPEFAATVLCSPLLYFPVRRIATLFNRRLKL